VEATRPADDPAGPAAHEVALVVDPDAVAAGAEVRGHLDAGRRAAGFVGDPHDPALSEFVTDVLRPS
jgi:hypothetical protein